MGEHHTELPWQASGVRVRLDGQPMLQVVGSKGVVAYVPYSDLTPEEHLESHGDLNLIVKACNSHDALAREIEQLRAWQRARLEGDDAARAERDALVKALEEILSAEKEFREGMPDNWEGDPLTDACANAREALAKAQP